MAKVMGIPSFTRSGKRTYYFDKAGKFISYAKYLNLQRFRPGRKGALTKAAAARRPSIQNEEKRLRQKFGGPPKGGTLWVKIASQYPDRFKAFTR